MQRHWAEILETVLDYQPSVGRLVEMCEENYRLLSRLLPQLQQMNGSYRSSISGHADLHLQVMEHAKYTSSIQLTYLFDDPAGHTRREPNALLRVYHDSCQVEVIDLDSGAIPLDALYEVPGLRNKWRANLFVAKWLKFCVGQGHQFTDEQQAIVSVVR